VFETLPIPQTSRHLSWVFFHHERCPGPAHRVCSPFSAGAFVSLGNPFPGRVCSPPVRSPHSGGVGQPKGKPRSCVCSLEITRLSRAKVHLPLSRSHHSRVISCPFSVSVPLLIDITSVAPPLSARSLERRRRPEPVNLVAPCERLGFPSCLPWRARLCQNWGGSPRNSSRPLCCQSYF
jgi:hypothetical protein